MARRWKREEIGYTGASFPWRLTTSGRVATSTVNFEEGDMTHIAEAIVQVIRTIKGERVMRRSWGASPVDVVFRPNTELGMLLAVSEIQDVLNEYEPRVSLIEGKVVDSNPEQGTVTLRLGFRHNKTQIVDRIEVTV